MVSQVVRPVSMWLTALLCLFAGVISIRATRAASLNDNASLKGIQGFYVVAAPNKAAEDAGLATEKMQTAIELRLRLAGIKVATREEWSKDTSIALLCLQIDFYDKFSTGGAYPNVTELSVAQTCTVAHNSHVCLVPTWSSTRYGLCTADTMEKASQELVDSLLNAYLEQNPKK
jgi:hypothetical protein